MHSASCKMCSCAYVHISTCLIGNEKPLPVQVAVGSGSLHDKCTH